MFDTEYYCKEYLKKEDRDKLDEIESLSMQIMNEQSVRDFVAENITFSKTARDIAGEIIDSYNEYLRDRIDVYILDFIMGKIDGYDEDELESIIKKADERKRLMIADAVRGEQA